MPVSVSPDYFAAYAKLHARARRAADALLRRLAAAQRGTSPPGAPVPRAPSFRLYRLPGVRDHDVLAWVRAKGDVVTFVWVGPRADAVRRASPRAPTARPGGGHPADGAVPVLDPATMAPASAAPTREDVPIHAAGLPTRMRNFCDRSGIATLGALAAIPPRDLAGQPNLGRLSVAQTRAVVERTLGKSWDALAAGSRPGTVLPATAPARPWDALRAILPRAVSELALDQLGLAGRVRSYAAAEGLRTLGDLARRSEAELLATSYLGHGSVRSLVNVVQAYLAQPWPQTLPPQHDLLASFRTILDELDPVDRDVVIRRSGLDGPKQTGEALSATLGHTGRYAYTREGRGLSHLRRRRAWVEDLRARADAAIGEGGAVALDTLGLDPWWAPAVASPEVLRYLGRRVLRRAFDVVRIEDHAYLARCPQKVLEEAWEPVRRTVEAARFPQLLAPLRARALRDAAGVGAVLSGALWERALALLVVHDDEDGRPRAFGLRARRAEAALAILRESPRPVRLRDLVERVGVLAPLPSEILHIGRDLVGAPRHFPRFADWTKRLVPIAVEVMGRRRPGRRWSHADVFEAVRAEIALPRWLDAWHLGALLRHSGRFGDAGFGFLTLPAGPEAKERKQKPRSLREALLAIVRDHGAPIHQGELRVRAAEETSFPSERLSHHLGLPPFVWCDAEHVGLVERDLPGGAQARARAVDHVAAALERRGRGLAEGELQREIAALSRAHARWSREMCLTALHGDARFRFSAAGGVGLGVWEGARVPSRVELYRQCLDAGRGRAKIAAIARTIGAHYGDVPDEERVVRMGGQLHAVRRGAWMLRGAAREE